MCCVLIGYLRVKYRAVCAATSLIASCPHAQTSQKEPAEGTTRRTLLSFGPAAAGAAGGAGRFEPAGFPAPLPADVLLVRPSPSGRLLARIVQLPAGGTGRGRSELLALLTTLLNTGCV